MVHAENAKVHILEDEAASRAYIDLMWAEAMFFYHNFPVRLTLSKEMNKELKVLQKQFMPEDTKAGLIQSFLDNYNGTQVCSKLIYAEALNHSFDEPKQWKIREINEIMNNSIEGVYRPDVGRSNDHLSDWFFSPYPLKANEQGAARAAKAVHAGGHQGRADSVFP